MLLEDYVVTENTAIIDVMKKIDKNASGNIFICKEGILLASVTDGDIRRSILQDIDKHDPISKIANYKPLSLNIRESRRANEVMRANVITALPIVDHTNRMVNIKFLLKNPVIEMNQIDIPVVIMAGGKGTRLRPYTDILPKPLIPIGDKTITEHIMEHFEHSGCHRFHMIVNYKKNFIKSYFADSEVPRTIDFLEEEAYLGTGGGLFLLQGIVNETFFLTNCDVLIEAEYPKILQHHQEQHNLITIVCAKKQVVVPYGTVDIDTEGYAKNFTEKPSFTCYTSTGMYVIEPQFLAKIKPNTALPITDMIQDCLKAGEKVGTYLVDEEDWMDMGQLEELEKMKEKMKLS
ncbi:MAG: sugar phosphate nucleotidyltransferase [Lachnospiraceae bacterium]